MQVASVSRSINPAGGAGAVEDLAGCGAGAGCAGGADLGDAFGVGGPFGSLVAGVSEPLYDRLAQKVLHLAVADASLAIAPLDLGEFFDRGEKLEECEQ